ncbi:beta-lactamase-like protein 2 [Podospora fimiseda]|uniref:Beta-lactamase-like protein 2 n=1 Tax=Podospora fimiseda TaxID=252190 RepID=A0AAN7BFP4_9PEZI|nr:beta-lactamase-like protein 2 [Podospora fimiseda]
MLFLDLILLGIAFFPLARAKANCPLYGTLLPKPTNFLKHIGIQTAASILDDIFLRYIDNEKSVGSEYFSYAVEVFSAAEDKPLWSHYWTAPSLKNFNSSGVITVDANTVFRIGSITKVFTVLTFLATVGDGIWNDPITRHLPEIEAIAANATKGAIFTPDWDSITVGSLASQTSGLIRDYALLGELSYQLNLTDLHDMGFPPLNVSEFPPCGSYPTCDREQLFEGLGKLPPSYGPFTTPTYSNLGFVLLSYIAERITGKEFKTLVQESVLDPLGLKHTFLSTPDDSVGIIPGTRRTTTWGFELAEESATGNMYTSPGDLSSLGRGILRSTLLKPAMTRRWLKPVSFTSDPKASVGMPWGIRQIQLEKNETYQFVHTFNKAGSLGAYSSLLAIIPELDIGFTIMAAGVVPAGLAMDIADTLTSTYVPTYMYVARSQAAETYAGEYRFVPSAASNNNTSNFTRGSYRRFANDSTPLAPTNLNSSLIIAIEPSKPGMGVYNWISNGTEMSYIAVAINANITDEYLKKIDPSVRMYPTGLEQKLPNGGKRVAFKAVFEDLSLPAKSNSFSSDCATWVGVTAVVYGSRPLDLFIFDFDKNGKVKSVENAALRARLEKVS